MADSLLYLDLELFLTGWYRTRLAALNWTVCEDLEVDRVEPDPGQEFPRRLLVIRDDGRTRTSRSTSTQSVGLTALMGSKENPADAMELLQIVLALSESLPSTDSLNPVTAVLSSTGPTLITERQPHARAYATLELATTGVPF